MVPRSFSLPQMKLFSHRNRVRNSFPLILPHIRLSCYLLTINQFIQKLFLQFRSYLPLSFSFSLSLSLFVSLYSLLNCLPFTASLSIYLSPRSIFVNTLKVNVSKEIMFIMMSMIDINFIAKIVFAPNMHSIIISPYYQERNPINL